MSLRTSAIAVVVLGMAALFGSPASAARDSSPTAEQLVYPGANLQTQLELNGNGAVALVGSAVDQVASDLENTAKDLEKHNPGDEHGARVKALLSLAGPARDALKGLTGVKLLVMTTPKPVPSDAFVRHYQRLMTGRGWSPLGFLKMKDDGPTITAMLAPETKGIFFAVASEEDVIVVTVTTEKPLGDLIAKAVRASGAKSPMDMVSGLFGKRRAEPAPKAAPAAPAPPAEPAPTPAPEEPPEPAEPAD